MLSLDAAPPAPPPPSLSSNEHGLPRPNDAEKCSSIFYVFQFEFVLMSIEPCLSGRSAGALGWGGTPDGVSSCGVESSLSL